MHRTLSAAPARQLLPQNTGLERAQTAWAEVQRAWETVLWQAKMWAYLPQRAWEHAENGDEGDLSSELESPTWIHHKPTAALTAPQDRHGMITKHEHENKTRT
ncbi:hypothetical protein CHARACLAT_027646 [Characodon lateralis]|uniref:Uncharacterized protein n=1 Tax=Characodon lateralis TaxID=208331 RepID=A0ABU7DCW2_9TELE|nr:hypothetical protein [Characodon lateralis]